MSALNSIKQKSTLSLIAFILDPIKQNPQSFLNQTESEKDQYLVSRSLSNQFTTNVKSDDKSNNAITIIERLFLNIGYRSSYKRLTEKAVYWTYKFFIYSVRHMCFKDQLALFQIRLKLRPFQALEIFLILQIEVDTSNRGIFVDKMIYKKVRYLIF